MAYQPEIVQYDVGIYQYEVIDPVDGGVGAVSNKPLLSLANRTAYLYQHVTNLENGTTIPPGIAMINSPNFTGTPTAPTPALGDNSTKIATTAFVQGTVNGRLSLSVAGSTNVTLTAVQAGNAILTFTGLLTANIAVIVPAASGQWIVENNTTGAFTLTVKTSSGSGIDVTQGRNAPLFCDGTNVQATVTDFPSIALTGTPTAPTAAASTNTTQIATTAYVLGQASSTTPAMNGTAAVGTGTTFARADHVHPTDTSRAPLASPTFTGTPTAPTPPQFDNDTSIATTAFVNRAIGSFSSSTVVLGTATTLTAAQAGGFFAVNAGNVTLPLVSSTTPGAAYTIRSSNPAISVIAQGSDTIFTNSGSVSTVPLQSGDSIQIVNNGGQWEVAGGTAALQFSPSLGVTPAVNDNSTKLATTEFVKNQNYQPALGFTPVQQGGGAGQGTNKIYIGWATNKLKVQVDLTDEGNLALENSPTFTGTPTSVTPAQFDNDTSIATTAFVQRALGSRSLLGASTTSVLTLNTSQVGQTIQYYGASAATWKLPACSTVANGGEYEIINGSAYLLTIVANGTDDIVNSAGAGNPSIILQQGDSIRLVGNQSTLWYATGGSAALQWARSLGVTAAQFDNSTRLATTGFVTRQGLQASTTKYITASVTMDASYVGANSIFGTNSGSTATLPLTTAVPSGACITIENFTSGNCTVAKQGTDAIFGNINASSMTSFVMQPGDSVVLFANLGFWYIVSGSVQTAFSSLFGSSLSGTGYQKLPSGLIVQWGNASVGSTDIAVNFPIAFPNACFQVVASSSYTAGSGAIGYVAAGSVTKTGFTARTSNPVLGWSWVATGN